LQNDLGEFAWIGAGRRDGKNGGEFSPIFYKKSKFQVYMPTIFAILTYFLFHIISYYQMALFGYQKRQKFLEVKVGILLAREFALGEFLQF
jgi:hypothetical protein